MQKVLVTYAMQIGALNVIFLNVRKSSMTFYMCKYMSMILYSVLLMSPFVRIFLIWCIMNLKCLWWGSLVFFWVTNSSIKGMHLHEQAKYLKDLLKILAWKKKSQSQTQWVLH